MKKILAILVLISVVILIIGCTAPEDTNTPDGEFIVSNAAEADDAVGDIGTDLSGINDSLGEIDDTLTEE